ncbi:response regulator [Mucilaginibacter ginsenosidivorans]|uniref:Response regulator n=1 Tax=Mucilaginibacter ginsenosidivorans TaxID=398053 RepID=A0A5B8UZU3_9SPHI|nr:response regulator [Mucilaginibacter ginsenosidivorans]QEC64509.1 response regulator [Mucilaginibacter ginsenosidivorans]
MKRLFIIEDDADVRDMLVFLFENNGHEVIKGDKAVSAEDLDKIKPHVVIIDYKLNGTAGAEVCARLKADELTKTIPVILYSSTEDIPVKGTMADAIAGKSLGLEDLAYLVHRLAFQN